MKIIISPAKKMKEDMDSLEVCSCPVFLEEADILLRYMRSLSFEEAKKLWRCNDKIAELNYGRLKTMDLKRRLTPALLAYEGIQYQYMAPVVFEAEGWKYIQERLRILSGFYGVLKPLDGVVPYRLEMQARAEVSGKKNLYEFWGRKLFEEVSKEDDLILNLASQEYSRCITQYLTKGSRTSGRSGKLHVLTCRFGERRGNQVMETGTQVKMARGEMVRFLAENQVDRPEEMMRFDGLGYHFCREMSEEDYYVFLKTK
ncbi:peroxide stress protein YaaA [Qiania dongpingensis]|uniref:UPF0246 protein H9Q78_01770 n=1 Tax=Qiania dongpingensis TaxID=2763669 RepID=A0A7G9G544_9FIRM|nr:peroxide stress protein YaaA [Qiania dongpingensis]QNM05926.1 peroxide stress protein YaaA [Qiania dongpingensis]